MAEEIDRQLDRLEVRHGDILVMRTRQKLQPATAAKWQDELIGLCAAAGVRDITVVVFDDCTELLSLHGAVVRDLNARARPLPRIVPYAFATRMPLLTLSNRLYGDAGRADELLAENRDTVHPLFMPASGRALSA